MNFILGLKSFSQKVVWIIISWYTLHLVLKKLPKISFQVYAKVSYRCGCNCGLKICAVLLKKCMNEKTLLNGRLDILLKEIINVNKIINLIKEESN